MKNTLQGPLDQHGITKIYKDSTRSDAPHPFVMGVGDWRQRIEQWDKDSHGNTIGKFEGSGLDIVFTSLANDKQRMNIFADPSKPKVPEKASNLNRDVLIQRPDNDGQKRGGWMARTNDWRDYEVTAIEFFPSIEGEDTSAWYGRGAKHTGESIDEGSQGSAIKPDLFYAGNKEGWHALKETIHFDPYKGSNKETVRGKGDANVLFVENIGNVKDKWIGIKTVVHNQPKKISSDGNEYWPVMIEAYFCNCDQKGNPNNNWELKFKCEDDPEKHARWSSLPNEQPGTKTHTISWGGPIITCRTDRQSGTGGGYPGMKFRKVSIREIEPGERF